MIEQSMLSPMSPLILSRTGNLANGDVKSCEEIEEDSILR